MGSMGEAALKALASAQISDLEEILYRSERTLTVRTRLPGQGSFILKKAIAVEAIGRLRHEIMILERLSQVAGVVKIAHTAVRANTLVLQDDDGISLSQFLKTQRLGPPQGGAMACTLAPGLPGGHRAGATPK